MRVACETAQSLLTDLGISEGLTQEKQTQCHQEQMGEVSKQFETGISVADARPKQRAHAALLSTDLEDRVGHEDSLLWSHLRCRSSDLCQILQRLLSGLGLSSSGLSGDDDGLADALLSQVRVRGVGDLEHVRSELAAAAVDVVIQHLRSVQRKLHSEEATQQRKE